MGFDHQDPEIVALMSRRGVEQGERLRADSGHTVNFDRWRMLDAARAADPTSILGDDDARRLAPAFIHELTPAQVAVLVDVFNRMAEQIAETITKVMETLTATFGPLDEFAAQMRARGYQSVDRDDVARVSCAFANPGVEPSAALADFERRVGKLRHGQAAQCPRHGPTKGGLCRKCTR